MKKMNEGGVTETIKKDRLGLRLETKWEISFLIIWMILTTAVIYSIPFPYDILVSVYALLSMWLMVIASERAYIEKLRVKK